MKKEKKDGNFFTRKIKSKTLVCIPKRGNKVVFFVTFLIFSILNFLIYFTSPSFKTPNNQPPWEIEKKICTFPQKSNFTTTKENIISINRQIRKYWNEKLLLKHRKLSPLNDDFLRLKFYTYMESPLVPDEDCVLQKNVMSDCYYNYTLLDRIDESFRGVLHLQRKCDLFTILMKSNFVMNENFQKSLESASRKHEDFVICVFQSDKFSVDEKMKKKILNQLHNVKWHVFEVGEALYHTPLHFFWEYHLDEWSLEISRERDVFDAVLWGIMYKMGGGVFFDALAGTIFKKSFEFYKFDTVFALEKSKMKQPVIGVSPIAFKEDSLFLKYIVNRFIGWYQGETVWNYLHVPYNIELTWGILPDYFFFHETKKEVMIEERIFWSSMSNGHVTQSYRVFLWKYFVNIIPEMYNK